MAAAFFRPILSARAGFLPVVLVLLSLVSFPGAVRAGEDYERWYTLEMAGQRAGYMHSQQKTADGRITTTTRIVLGLGRGTAAVSVSMEGTFVETTDGKPVSMECVQTLGKTPVSTRYTFTGSDIAIESDQAGQVTKMTKPLPEGAWLTPAAAGEYVRRRLEAGATEIIVRTIDPLSGLEPASITRKGIQPTVVRALGKTDKGFECTAVSSASPGVESVEVLDSAGIPVRSNASMGGISVKIVTATREQALAKAEAPEMMLRTFVKPDRAIQNPRELRSATYILRLPDGERPELPDTGTQHVEKHEDGTRITVDAGVNRPAPAGDLKDPAYRSSSPILNSEDPAVSELARQAVAEAGQAPIERAESMRRFVHQHIRQKDLGVGFASASEVARSRQGDCTEHATLLAAMLRAEGIPSRVASGLVYADQFAGERDIFGYHMWTQALIEVNGTPTWMDFDATLPGARFDATHIALAVSSLPDADAGNSLSSLIPLMGRLQIRVESTGP